MPVCNERYLLAESIRGVLAVEASSIRQLDLIIVDDGSEAGTREILAELAEKHADRITYVEHPQTLGKGAAVRTGMEHAQGEVCVIQPADLRCDPGDFAELMLPFERENADAVYGSRFLPGDYRRVPGFRDTFGTQLRTWACNFVSDLDLTDMETPLKAVRTSLLRSIPIRSHDHRIELELTIKLAKRKARIFEVPISYRGSENGESNQVGLRDGFFAVWAMLKHAWQNDAHDVEMLGGDGLASTLAELTAIPRFNRWMAEVIRPYVGDRVLEVGAGLGSLTESLLPRLRFTATDVSPHYVEALRRFTQERNYLDVRPLDITESDDFYDLLGGYDTVICLNVLEHIEDHDKAVRNMRSALSDSGRMIVLVPQNPARFGSLDELVGHQRRYTRKSLGDVLANNGLEVEQLFDFNRATVPGWWWNGQVRKKRSFDPTELKLVDRFTWLMRIAEPLLPWSGNSLIAVARRKD